MADNNSQPIRDTLPNDQDEWPEPGEGFVDENLPGPSKDGMVHLDDLPLEVQVFI